MNTINNIFNFPRIFIKILYSLGRQKVFIKCHIDPILDSYSSSGLSHSDITKIRKYYGNAVPSILGEGFCILRGSPLSQRERFAMTYLGSLTGLYDDFFDKLDTQENHIFELTINPFDTTLQNIHESLFAKLYRLALLHCPSSELLKQKFIEVYKAQIQSKLQYKSSLASSHIEEITYLKGGTSLLFYRSALNDKPDEFEEAFLYGLGSLMQLENDVFDVYKDYQNNISTLVTKTKKVNELRETYTELHREVIKLVSKTKFPRKNKILFARFINLIICRGYVCLDCLEKNEKLTNNVFSIELYSRKMLICDMEKFRNSIKTFKYYAKSNVSILK